MILTPYLNRIIDNIPDFYEEIKGGKFVQHFFKLIKNTKKELFFETDFEKLKRELRLFKKKASLLIALADLSNTWNLKQVTQALSLVAETSVKISLSFLLRQAEQKNKWKIENPNKPELNCGITILAMGKLGARELNYSSDIDLIVLFDEDKTPYLGSGDIGSFMVRLVKNLLALLDEKTVDGYVFRTDLRLRPDPGSTPVAMSVNAAMYYYESFAQNWERAAYIKARPVAGDIEVGEKFLKDMTSFVWRKTIDFYALEQMQALKNTMNLRQKQKEGVLGTNIKLGKGGIREIEFFTQFQQLLWGGKDKKVRSRQTVQGLLQLTEAGWVKPEISSHLIKDYIFLRTLEHRLQMVQDEQTQILPEKKEDYEFIAQLMNLSGNELTSKIENVREFVSASFNSLFEKEGKTEDLALDFSGTELPDYTRDILTEWGFHQIDLITDSVHGWLCGRYRAMRSEKARIMVNQLLYPMFLSLSRTADPDGAFTKLDIFFKGLPSGIQLFSLFQTKPVLLDLLIDVISNSPLFSVELTRHPDLFEAVLTRGFFEADFSVSTLLQQAEVALSSADDLGIAMDLARRFVLEKKFQIAVLVLRKILPVEDAPMALSNVAEVVIQKLSPIVLKDFEQTNGIMPNGKFSVVVMGKAGSKEMSFTSDLDLLFLYDAPDGAVSEGKKQYDVSVYYAKLAQKFIHAISLNTAQGVLYPIDMRLRPSGNAGPVAVSLSSFVQYYHEKAWTWELMALTKARVLWGEIGRNEIQSILLLHRDAEQVKKDVAEMRQKVAENFPSKSEYDVKYKKGGMIDIEFFVQQEKLIDPRLNVQGVLPTLKQMGNQSDLEKKYQELIKYNVLFSLTLENGQNFENAPYQIKEKINGLMQ